MASHHTPRPNVYNDDDDEDDENDAVTPLNPNLNRSNMNRIIHFNNHNNNDNNNNDDNNNVNNSNNSNTDPQNDAVVDDDEDDDVDVDDDDVDEDSTSSTDPSALHHHHHHHHHHSQQPPAPPIPAVPVSVAGQVTIALPIPNVTVAASSAGGATTTVVEEKKPFPIDESRKLFQRLWTDEDEIELLQGFLEYTTQRGANGSSHHHDTTAFYDQIKSKLQLDFNKNQLVEKLRRLKKKYRNVMQKIGSGKEYVFKSPHDQTTFEISRKIWSGAAVRNSGGGGSGGGGGGGGGGGASAAVDDGGFDEDDPSPNPNPNFTSALIDCSPNPNGVDDRKMPIRSRKRMRGSVGVGGPNTPPQFNQQQPVPVGIAAPTPTTPATATATATATTTSTATATAIPSVIEDTVRSCLSPIFKELLQSVVNLNNNGSRGLGGVAFSPMPLGLGFGVSGGIGAVDFSTDDRWRKQQILELEVFSRRLELVQDQIKAQLDELRGKGG